MKAHLVLELQNECTTGESIPSRDDFKEWLSAALHQLDNNGRPIEVCVRIVDDAEMRRLNSQFRHKQEATNVLSFPAWEGLHPDIVSSLEQRLLGDIVISAAVVSKQAEQLQKPLSQHWAQMAIHGLLHLLGYDHKDNADFEVMKGLETKIMKRLGYEDPYA